MFIFILLKLLGSMAITLFLPGYFLLHALKKNKAYSLSLEQLILSVGLSLMVVDVLFILLNLIHLPITRTSSLAALVIFCLVSYFFTFFYGKAENTDSADKNFSLNNLQKITFLVIFSFSVLIRCLYISQGAIPQTTDLGHHMYWAKSIAVTGALPDYGMPDFIIGEHIIFGVIGTISQIDFVSAMPVVILFFINIISLLSLYLLTYRLGEIIFSKKIAADISLLSLFTIGVLYSISSPQAKFVSGGVIGNVTGNFLMPLILYSFISGIYYSKPEFPAKRLSRFYFLLFILFSVTLAYTHHLTTFVFLFVFLAFTVAYFFILFLLNRFQLKKVYILLALYFKNLFCWQNIFVILFFLALLVFLYPPSYLNPSAIDTAVGTPVKETRVGMDLFSLSLTTGPWRFFYSFLGIMMLGIYLLKLGYKSFLDSTTQDLQKISEKLMAFLLAVLWFIMILIMSYKPALLKVDIPSNRIASYLTIPSAILSAIALKLLIQNSQAKFQKIITAALFILLISTAAFSGLGDVSDAAREQVNVSAVRQVYASSNYLSMSTASSDIILKDHIFLPADSWIKLFLMRDYKNPLSRSLLKRYEDIAKDRETCTRDMVAIPDSQTALDCFSQTGTKYVMLRVGFDTDQFDKSPNFSKVYVSKDVVIYKLN